MLPKCDTCKWFVVDPKPRPVENIAVGACRRYPPTVLTDEDETWSQFTYVTQDLYCGEHEFKQQN